MTDLAVFQGSLVNLKNSPTHKSVILQVEVPEEYGEAIVRAFGWPTRVKPLQVAVARLEGSALTIAMARLEGDDEQPKHRHFNELTFAEQAGILCKNANFYEFLQTTSPYKEAAAKFLPPEWKPEEMVRYVCGVESRADINEHEESGRQWRLMVYRYRAWRDARDRAEDVDF